MYIYIYIVFALFEILFAIRLDNFIKHDVLLLMEVIY